MHERENEHNESEGESKGVVADGGGERERDDGPRIYVASLSDYNAGRLHGAWIDAAQDVDELHDGVRAMLAASPEPGAEEFAIHDYEGFGPLGLSEFTSLETVSRIAKGIAEHGLGFAAWAANVGADDVETLERFQDVYLGVWPSLEDYATDLFADLGYDDLVDTLIPAWLRPYVEIDVDGFARDLQLSGDVTVVEKPDGGVWIFDGRL
jgi:antirestriction protein